MTINNFKGVMLCNRPNENVMIVKEKPFYSRFQPYDQWRLTIKYEEPKMVVLQTNPVLEKHKKWLEEFKLQNQIKKHAKEELQAREKKKKMKEDYKQMNEIIKKELSEEASKSKIVALTSENLKILEEKDSKSEQDWDKTTTNGDQKVSLEDRIAKHVADEILNQYKVQIEWHVLKSLKYSFQLFNQENIRKRSQEDSPRDWFTWTCYSVIRNENAQGSQYLHSNPAI